MNPSFDINKIRAEFPILNQQVNGKPLVYLDNGATTQKPLSVINEISTYYETINSNVHRGVHHLSQLATDAHEAARRSVQHFINAQHEHEIIFTRGTTESINLVAYSFGKAFIKPGDEVIVTAMEHHSNIVPWQIANEDRGGVLKVIPFDENGRLMVEKLPELITEKTKIIAVTWVSNTLGTVNPIKEIIALAHQHNIPVLIDAAQGIQHFVTDVQDLDADFLVFSGHKIYGPTGIGVLYGKEKWLNQMPPYQGGGSMIKEVKFNGTTYTDLPFKFEAGTPDVSGTIGLHKALDWVSAIGFDYIHQHEHELMLYAEDKLKNIPNLRIIGNAAEKAATISFVVGNIHPFDLGEILDNQGIAVRTGHHCTQPIMEQFCIPGTVRASFGIYNTFEEVDKLVDAIHVAIKMLQ